MRKMWVSSIGLVALICCLISCDEGGFEFSFPNVTPVNPPPPQVQIHILPPDNDGEGMFKFGVNPHQVNAGSDVVWINDDSIAHTVTSTQGLFDSGPIGPGASFVRNFPEVGTFPYNCTLHPAAEETGSLNVVNPDITAVPSPQVPTTPAPSPLPEPTQSQVPQVPAPTPTPIIT